MFGTDPAVGNGYAKRAVSDASPLLSQNSGSVEVKGLDKVAATLRRLERDRGSQILRSIGSRSSELERTMKESGWPDPKVTVDASPGRLQFRVRAARSPAELEYGSLRETERPAIRRFVQSLGQR